MVKRLVQVQRWELMLQVREQIQQKEGAGRVGLLAVASVWLMQLALVPGPSQPAWLQQQRQPSWPHVAVGHPQSSPGD